MERCPSCGRKMKLIKLGFMPRPLCEGCFCKNVERRVRREIRILSPLSKGDVVVLVDDGSREARMLEFIFTRLQKAFPFTLKKSKRVGNGQGKYASPINLDEAASAHMKEVLLGKNKNKQLLTPLWIVHADEVKLFTKIKRLGGVTKKSSGKLEKQLDMLEQKHPQLKFSIVRFFRNL